MKYVKWKNARIAYSVEGKGTAVLLVHGFCEDSTIWEKLKEDLLEEQYKVICVDLPGFGKSSALENTSIDEMATCVWAVLDQIRIKRVIFIGHSMGGYVGLAFAGKNPGMIKGLGLFHSHPFADSEEKKTDRLKSVQFIQKQGHILYVKQLIPKLFSEKFVKSNAFLVDKLIYRASTCSAGAITEALMAMISRPDRSEVLKQADFPVLFIIGQEDTAVPAQSSVDQIPLPDVASIHILDKVGHMGMFEAPRKCQRIIRDFAGFCLGNIT